MNIKILLIICLSLLWGFIYAETVDYIVADGYGPYALSSANPQNLSVSISKNTVDPIGYNVNEEKGTIYFVKPPARGKVVKVRYETPVLAQTVKNDALHINSYKDTEGNISMFDGNYRAGDLGVDFALLNRDGSADTENMGGRLSYNRNFGKITLGATYSATGDNLNNVGNYKTENDLLQVLAAYNENDIALDSRYIRYTETKKTLTSNNIRYNFCPDYALSLGYDTELNEITEERGENIAYGLTGKIKSYNTRFYGNFGNTPGKNLERYGIELGNGIISASALSEKTFYDNGDVTVRKAGASYNNRGFSVSGDTNETDDDVRVSRNYNASMGFSGTGGNITVGTGLSYTDNIQTGVKSTASGSWKIGKHSTVRGAYTGEKPGEDMISSYEAGFGYTNGDRFGFSSSYKTTKTHLADTVYEGNASLTFSPNKYLAWTVNYLNRELAADSRFSSLRLTGNYKKDKFNIFGLYIDRNDEKVSYEDTKSARLTYELFRFLELSSQWTDNPENGELYTDRSEYNYGVKLKFGDFGISGNVYET
ncbi:MAG: hypothetical protein KBT47_04110, partial [Armatimonadetes bacterium]|nr:hypothetical protein [Candidatus Hippobium faecium]